MSAFTIIIVIVTLAYIIYYGTAISQDVIRASKEETPDTETFTLEGMESAVEQPVSVIETEEGFKVDTDPSEVQPQEADQQMVFYENLPDAETPSNLHEGMNEVNAGEMTFDEEYPADEFERFMQNRHKTVLQPINDEKTLDRI